MSVFILSAFADHFGLPETEWVQGEEKTKQRNPFFENTQCDCKSKPTNFFLLFFVILCSSCLIFCCDEGPPMTQRSTQNKQCCVCGCSSHSGQVHKNTPFGAWCPFPCNALAWQFYNIKKYRISNMLFILINCFSYRCRGACVCEVVVCWNKLYICLNMRMRNN